MNNAIRTNNQLLRYQTKQINKQTNKQKKKQTNKQTDRQKQTNKQTNKQTKTIFLYLLFKSWPPLKTIWRNGLYAARSSSTLVKKMKLGITNWTSWKHFFWFPRKKKASTRQIQCTCFFQYFYLPVSLNAQSKSQFENDVRQPHNTSLTLK